LVIVSLLFVACIILCVIVGLRFLLLLGLSSVLLLVNGHKAGGVDVHAQRHALPLLVEHRVKVPDKRITHEEHGAALKHVWHPLEGPNAHVVQLWGHVVAIDQVRPRRHFEDGAVVEGEGDVGE